MNNFNITIVLTIYNRLNFTIKWLDFVEKQKIPFDIIISDGGNIANIQEKLNLNIRDLNIKYYKFKFYKNFKNFHEKFNKVVKYVKTKYVIFAEDDDYIIHKSFIKSKNFLEKNKDFSCVKGIGILGELNTESKLSSFLSLRIEDINCKKFSFSDNCHEKRLINYVKFCNTSLWNGLHKVSNTKKIFKILNKNFYNFQITETIFNLMTVRLGKILVPNYIDYIKMDNTEFSSSSNFEKLRLSRNLFDQKKINYDNLFFLKYLKLKNHNSEFLSLYNKKLEENKNSESFNANNKKKIKQQLINLIRLILIKIRLKFFFKYIMYSFKYKKISKKIFVVNKEIIFLIKKNITFLNKIYNYNYYATFFKN